MKLAEALTEVKRMSEVLTGLTSHFGENCVIVGGVKPERDARKLVAQITSTIEEREKLALQIATTNATTKLPCGLTIHEALLRRTSLKLTATTFTGMQQSLRYAKQSGYGAERNVLREYTVKPEEVEHIANTAGKELRQLEAQLQSANWTTELVGA